MSDAKYQQEPSMEEILASIRRIISEDIDAQGDPKPVSAAAASNTSNNSNVLDLTERVPDDDATVQNPVRRNLNLETELPVAFDDEPDEVPGFQSAHELSFDDDDFGPGLISEQSAHVAKDAFLELDRATAKPEPAKSQNRAPRAVNGAMTLDELVREALRPVLSQWLDAHLPPMVERLVRQEIQRVTQSRQR